MSSSIQPPTASGNLEIGFETKVYNYIKEIPFTVKIGASTFTMNVLIIAQRIGNIVSLKINEIVIERTQASFILSNKPTRLVTGIDMNGQNVYMYSNEALPPEFSNKRDNGFVTIYHKTYGNIGVNDDIHYYGTMTINSDGIIRISGDGNYMIPTYNILRFRYGIQANYVV